MTLKLMLALQFKMLLVLPVLHSDDMRCYCVPVIACADDWINNFSCVFLTDDMALNAILLIS